MEIPRHSAKQKAANRAAAKSKREQIVQGDEVLVKLTGLESGTRAEYVNRIWCYILQNKLLVTQDGSIIKLDKDLAKLMGNEGLEGQEFNSIRMSKRFDKHYIKQ